MLLGLESSCDETALALFDPASGLAGEWIASQVELHAAYGGVVPDLASREHLAAFGPMLARVWESFDPARLTGLAVTAGPGLAGCLAMGITTARALQLALGLPLTPVNHLRGHLLSPFIPLHREDPASFASRLDGLLPHLGLIVSGGNTQLVSLEADGSARMLAETGDDAAGEALDKGAKLLGLGYPGGPRIEKLGTDGNPKAFPFPKSIPQRGDRRFSFSGLKTALRNTAAALPPAELQARLPDVCASYQAAVIESLVRKARVELEDGRFASVGLSGGVANNRSLRAAFAELAEKFQIPLLPALPAHTGDNAAMIAFAAWLDTRLHPAGAWPANGGPAAWELDPSWRLA